MTSALFFLLPAQFFFFCELISEHKYNINFLIEHKIFLLPPCSNSNWLFPKGSTFFAVLSYSGLSFSYLLPQYHATSLWLFCSRKFMFLLRKLFMLTLYFKKTRTRVLLHQRSVYLFSRHTLLVYVICWPPDYSPHIHWGCHLDHSFFLPERLLLSWVISTSTWKNSLSYASIILSIPEGWPPLFSPSSFSYLLLDLLKNWNFSPL